MIKRKTSAVYALILIICFLPHLTHTAKPVQAISHSQPKTEVQGPETVKVLKSAATYAAVGAGLGYGYAYAFNLLHNHRETPRIMISLGALGALEGARRELLSQSGLATRLCLNAALYGLVGGASHNTSINAQGEKEAASGYAIMSLWLTLADSVMINIKKATWDPAVTKLKNYAKNAMIIRSNRQEK